MERVRRRTACFLDFDHTLFHTDAFFHVDVRDAALRQGVDRVFWEKSYERVQRFGYTLEAHLADTNRLQKGGLRCDDIRRSIMESFSDLRRYVFPDVVPFLEGARQNGAHLFLMSFGNPQWQRYKVEGAGIAEYFDNMFFVPQEGGKGALVAEEKETYGRLIAVDNNPAELDAITDAAPGAATYCMNRVPEDMRVAQSERERLLFLEARRYTEKPWRHPHIACRNLGDILGVCA